MKAIYYINTDISDNVKVNVNTRTIVLPDSEEAEYILTDDDIKKLETDLHKAVDRVVNEALEILLYDK